MDAHAYEDRLALCAAGPGLRHLVGAVMDDRRARQGEAQRLHDRALQIGFGSTTAAHAAPPFGKAAAPAKKVAAKAPAKKAPAKKAATKRTPNAAFMKALTPSDALAAIIGKGPYPRTEVTKKIWDYIKKNKLQDAANKRMINADAKLKEIFKKAQASMFEMTKLISSHLK